MNLEKLRPETQRLLAITIPGTVLLLAAVLVLPRAVGLWIASQQLDMLRQEAETQKQRNAWGTQSPRPRQLPALPPSRDEQLSLLKELGHLVTASRVRLVSYRPPANSGGDTPTADAGSDRDRLLRPIATDVTVAGPYGDLHAFFTRLAGADRLFTVKSVQIRAEAYPELTAVFRLVRYVTPTRPATVSH